MPAVDWACGAASDCRHFPWEQRGLPALLFLRDVHLLCRLLASTHILQGSRLASPTLSQHQSPSSPWKCIMSLMLIQLLVPAPGSEIGGVCSRETHCDDSSPAMGH